MNKILNQIKEKDEFFRYYFQLYHHIMMIQLNIVQLINQLYINDFYIEHIVMVRCMINMKEHNELENIKDFIHFIFIQRLLGDSTQSSPRISRPEPYS